MMKGVRIREREELKRCVERYDLYLIFYLNYYFKLLKNREFLEVPIY